MALTYAKDIPDLIHAVSANPDLIELESDVSTIAGDVTELALEVSQLSASVLPMASDDSTTIKENIDILNAGRIIKGVEYNLNNSIFIGYNTGSGNYLEFFIPCEYDETISGCQISNISTLNIMSTTASQNCTESDIDFTYCEVYKTNFGLRIELKYLTTQVMSVLRSINFTSGTITFS